MSTLQTAGPRHLATISPTAQARPSTSIQITLAVPPGAIGYGLIRIPIVDDYIIESNETIVTTLTAGSGYQLTNPGGGFTNKTTTTTLNQASYHLTIEPASLGTGVSWNQNAKTLTIIKPSTGNTLISGKLTIKAVTSRGAQPNARYDTTRVSGPDAHPPSDGETNTNGIYTVTFSAQSTTDASDYVYRVTLLNDPTQTIDITVHVIDSP